VGLGEQEQSLACEVTSPYKLDKFLWMYIVDLMFIPSLAAV